MQVYKACFKVIRQNLPSMLIYVVIFLAFVLMLTAFFQSPDQETDFQPSRIRTAVIAADPQAPISASLIGFLDEQTQRVDLDDDREVLQDALFHYEVSYILYIPAGFDEAFLTGSEDAVLERSLRPDSYSGVQIDLLIDRYLNLTRLYLDHAPNLSPQEVDTAVLAAMQVSSQVEMQTAAATPGTRQSTRYFQYLAYSLMAVTILCICSVMLVFTRKDIRQRNHCSPLPLLSFNKQMVLGNLTFGLILWLILVLFSYPLGAARIDPREWMLLSFNALIFTFSCLSLSFLISQFISKRSTMQTVANVLALGTCFISGVFVPLDFLGDSIQFIASFTPTYWYIRAVNDIDRLSDFGRQNLQSIGGYWLIQIGFALVMLMIALAVIKQKRQTSR